MKEYLSLVESVGRRNIKIPLISQGDFLLREQDSNLQPCGYGRFRDFRSGPDYLITLECPREESRNTSKGSGASGAYW
jgi:hypothetical protein